MYIFFRRGILIKYNTKIATDCKLRLVSYNYYPHKHIDNSTKDNNVKMIRFEIDPYGFGISLYTKEGDAIRYGSGKEFAVDYIEDLDAESLSVIYFTYRLLGQNSNYYCSGEEFRISIPRLAIIDTKYKLESIDLFDENYAVTLSNTNIKRPIIITRRYPERPNVDEIIDIPDAYIHGY